MTLEMPVGGSARYGRQFLPEAAKIHQIGPGAEASPKTRSL